MGNQLPGFQRELKIRRRLGPPFFRRFQGGWLVKGLLDLHDLEGPEIFGLGLWEAATANLSLHHTALLSGEFVFIQYYKPFRDRKNNSTSSNEAWKWLFPTLPLLNLRNTYFSPPKYALHPISFQKKYGNIIIMTLTDHADTPLFPESAEKQNFHTLAEVKNGKSICAH